MCGYRARCEVVCNCFDSDITDNNNDNNNNNIKKIKFYPSAAVSACRMFDGL